MRLRGIIKLKESFILIALTLLLLCSTPAWAFPGFTLLTPISGALVPAGQPVTITWTGGDPSGNVSLSLIDVNSNSVSLGIGPVPNSGTFIWTIPLTIGGGTTCGKPYRYYVEDIPRTMWTYGSTFTVACPTMVHIADGDVAGLIAAINAANSNPGPDTISLAPAGTYTLTAADNSDGFWGSNGLPRITSPLTILGNGATIQRSTAPGTPAFRILFLDTTPVVPGLTNLTLDSVTIQGGLANGTVPSGGGLAMSGGTVLLTRSTVTGNSSAAGGGGIANLGGKLTIETSTISFNRSFSGSSGGGGILNASAYGPEPSLATTMIDFSTIFENRADVGLGDAIADAFSVAGSIVIKNSIFTSPTLGAGTTCSIPAPVSKGRNIAGDASCGLHGDGDLSNTNPLLGPLANNGGPTPTHMPLAGSPAINTVPLANCSNAAGETLITDQRGITRPQGSACEVGSVEVIEFLNTFNIANGDVSGLIAAINSANASGQPSIINLAPGGNYTLTAVNNAAGVGGFFGDNGLPAIKVPLTMNGNGATIQRSTDANTPGFRIFFVDTTPVVPQLTNLTLNDVTIKGGLAAGNIPSGGALAMSGGTVLIRRSTITENSGSDAGGIANFGGKLIVENSTISYNTSLGGRAGGGILNGSVYGPTNDPATTTISNSTLFENQSSGRRGTIADAFSPAPEITLKNSIIASPSLGLGATCNDFIAISAGHNIADDASCGLSGVGDFISTNPMLGPTANNGGPTPTSSPLLNSPAIDAVPVSFCTDTFGTPITMDQRGVPRPQGNACDIGSVEILAPTTTVSAIPALSVFGQNVAFTATISVGSTPVTTGSVTFSDGETILAGSVALDSNGQASFHTANLSVGNHTITVTSSGSGALASSGSTSQTVNAADTLISISSNLSPAEFGQSVTITAHLSVAAPGAGSPTGTIHFMDGGVDLGPPASLNGATSTTFAGLPAGSHHITASYSGDGNFNASTSAVLDENIVAAATTTQLSSTINPAVLGTPLTFTAGVSTFTTVANTGGVRFTADGSTIAGCESIPVSPAGTAMCTPALVLPVGDHPISAQYLGGANFNPSSRSIVETIINKVSSNTSISASLNSSSYGQSVNFTATVSGLFAVGPTGTVQFRIDGSPSGSPVTVSANGTAVAAITTVPTGNHSITAVYNGDGNYNSSTSAGITQSVNKVTPAITLTSNVNPSVSTQGLVFTASITTLLGSPTGSVLFSDGPTPLFLTAVITDSPTHGSVAINTQALGVGTHHLTAVYSSTNSNLNGGNAALTQVVNPPDAPPFSRLVIPPDGACICTPVVENDWGIGSQHWFAAANNTSMTVTAIASAVNSTDPETVQLDVFDLSGQSMGSVSASYPANTPAGTEASNSLTFNTTPGAIYRLVVSTPNAPPTQGNRLGQTRYRLKILGASEAGMPNILGDAVKTESGNTSRWLFNADAGETLGFAVSPGQFVPPGATTATVQLFNLAAPGVPIPLIDLSNPNGPPAASLTLNAAPGAGLAVKFVIAAEPAVDGGIYALVLTQVDGHYRLQKFSGSDKGIYAAWNNDDAQHGKLTVAIDTGNLVIGNQLYALTSTDTLSGHTLGTFQTEAVTQTYDDVGVGRYHLEFSAPAGYSITPSQIDIDVTCGETTTIHLVMKAITTTSITAAPIVFGANGVVTVNVGSGAGTVAGSVSLSVDGGTPFSLGLNGSGQATLSVGILNAGDHSLSASYGGNGDLLASSATGTLHVDKALATVTLGNLSATFNGNPQSPTVATSPANLGFTLSGAPQTNAGSYPVSAAITDTNYLGSASDSFVIAQASSATHVTCPSTLPYNGTPQTPCSAATLGADGLNQHVTVNYTNNTDAGTATASATFAGDANHSGSNGSTTFSITPLPTTTLLAPLSTAIYGQAVILTAQVSTTPGSLTPPGNIVFSDGGITLGSAPVNLSGGLRGQASLSVFLGAGTHNVTAAYGGSLDFIASSSAARSLSIAPATTTTQLTSSLNPSSHGQTVNFAATVIGQYGGPVTGVVSFKDGANKVLGTATVVNGTAMLPLSTLGTGSHSVTAVYGGNANDAGSTSAAITQSVVDPTPTTPTLSSSLNPARFAEQFTVTATVSSSGVGTPTGALTLMLGNTPLNPVSLSNGQATFSLSLSPGTWNLTAVYSGDSRFAGSTSPVLAEVVNKSSTTTTLSSAPNPSSAGQLVTFTVNVVPSPPLPGFVPQGAVSFMKGNTTLGVAGLDASGNASFSTSALSSGNNNVKAVYNSNVDFSSSTSNTVLQVVH